MYKCPIQVQVQVHTYIATDGRVKGAIGLTTECSYLMYVGQTGRFLLDFI